MKHVERVIRRDFYKKNYPPSAEFFCKNFKGRKTCVLVKKNFFGGESVKNLEIKTERETVLFFLSQLQVFTEIFIQIRFILISAKL